MNIELTDIDNEVDYLLTLLRREQQWHKQSLADPPAVWKPEARGRVEAKLRICSGIIRKLEE